MFWKPAVSILRQRST